MTKIKPSRLLLSAGLLFVCAWIAVSIPSSLTAQAAPDRQIPIYTPTPGPDGRIIYIVQENDTLLSISLLTNVPVEELRELNSLTDDFIYPGQELLLGLGGPPEVTFTPGPSPTPTPVLPTPTPKPGTGNLCILLFEDLNGDSLRQEEEPSIPGGAISVSNRSGTFSKTADTLMGLDPICYEEVPEGDFNVSVAVPEDYNPTTVMNYAFQLNAGDETILNFGAQANSEIVSEAPTPTGEGKSPILGILGGVLLLAGVGLALFAGRLMKGK